MPYLQTAGQLKIPFGGRSPRAKRTSLQGARAACVNSGSQKARMLLSYLQYGAQTDHEMAARMGKQFPESRVSARRGSLADRHLIYWVKDVMGPCGAENGQYGLTPYGRQVAMDLEKASVA